MNLSLRHAAGAVVVGALAWMVVQHGRGGPQEGKAEELIDRLPRGSTQSLYEVI